MRTLQITHEEIELIKNALQYISDVKIDNLRKNSNIISMEESEIMIKSAKKYYNTLAIFDGERDV